MRLQELISEIDILNGPVTDDPEIVQVTSDSRKVRPGALFVAVKGASQDGHKFIPSAWASGAVAVALEDPSFLSAGGGGPSLHVDSTRVFLDLASARVHGQPTQSMICIGVTGTNGKTTITHLIERILTDQGYPTAVIGTIDHHLGARKFPATLTTPGSEQLQARLREFHDLGARALAMEVSSHALDQHRVDSIQFDVGVFINLTRDHLDYHQTMEDYFRAKERFFDELLWRSLKPSRWAVLNADDPYSARVRTGRGVRRFLFGERGVDFKFEILSSTLEGLSLDLTLGKRKLRLKSPLIGNHNASNLAAALSVSEVLGLSMEGAVETLSRFSGVRGRLERIPNARGIHVFVDYAHTDDALRNVLKALAGCRDSSGGGVLRTVFGCGGDRDRGKRPLMARVAEELSDEVIITSDNPRTEDPELILGEIHSGFSESFRNHVVRIVDRRGAIQQALAKSRPGDVVLIAGKGHEDYQIVGLEKRPFDDAQVVREVLG